MLTVSQSLQTCFSYASYPADWAPNASHAPPFIQALSPVTLVKMKSHDASLYGAHTANPTKCARRCLHTDLGGDILKRMTSVEII